MGVDHERIDCFMLYKELGHSHLVLTVLVLLKKVKKCGALLCKEGSYVNVGQVFLEKKLYLHETPCLYGLLHLGEASLDVGGL